MRKGKLEKYKVSSSIVYSLSQEDFGKDISVLYQELRDYKKKVQIEMAIVIKREKIQIRCSLYKHEASVIF